MLTHLADEERIERINKRVEVNDANAIYILGCHYLSGERGLPQDYEKAMELWLRAEELGHAKAYNNLGFLYHHGKGVRKDTKKDKYYLELGAMGGDVLARHNLGSMEWNAGNTNRAVKHYRISAGAGYDESLKNLRECENASWEVKLVRKLCMLIPFGGRRIRVRLAFCLIYAPRWCCLFFCLRAVITMMREVIMILMIIINYYADGWA